MIKALLAAALFAASLPCAHADVLALPPDAGAASDTVLPAKGSSMAAVSREFGAPRVRHPAVGGDSPKHPPITRWDYETFSVFFENQHVVDAVRPDAPTPVAHREDLTTP
ncbi:phosphodiesterase [Hydrocarboniphaga sp.]|uniref:phosphodiesterase n=1 Tax=Hydrocarboniphaga sp. TaxID=2033016 RepID=UPI003D0EFDAD